MPKDLFIFISLCFSLSCFMLKKKAKKKMRVWLYVLCN